MFVFGDWPCFQAIPTVQFLGIKTDYQKKENGKLDGGKAWEQVWLLAY